MDALAQADALLRRGARRSRGGHKLYEAAALSRAEGRGPGERGRKPVWIAGDFRAGTFRTRREALKHCAPGALPILLVPGDEGGRPSTRPGGAR